MHNLNGVFIIPTGLGCALGGDAAYNPGVKLIANCVDNLIVNPNAVNASDINELPSNALYVEGSTIDRFLDGKLNLRKTKTHNKILCVVNNVGPSEINTVNAGIWGLGADIKLITLNTPLVMKASFNEDGTATGTYSGVDELIQQVSYYNFDALAIQTFIDCDEDIAHHYWNNGGINPWGGIEAIVSRLISERLNKPVAHGPGLLPDHYKEQFFAKVVVAKQMAPEIISTTFMFCVLKGLHRAPKIELDTTKLDDAVLRNSDIDFLLSPHGCWGRPHDACVKKNIPIIVVRENTTCFSKDYSYPYQNDNINIIFVDNYLEAAGVIRAMNCGVDYRQIKLLVV